MDPAQALETAEIERNSIINETIFHGDSDIQRFYDDTVVLITGGSGFLGKQLIEKLMRSCNIKKIYVVLRPHTNKCVQTRLNQTLEDPVYEYLHKTKPSFMERIVPISGDITKIKLGITEEQWTVLTEEVNIIFHVAATINFTEPLKLATVTNVRGTREMLDCAKACKNLKSFVHVSTAYSHATYQRIKKPVLEQFYECPVSPKCLIELVEGLDDKKIEVLTPHLIENWPNTYSFTKAVAEELVRTTSDGLPICIVRPAIVIGAYRETPGWVDKTTINGPVGFVMGAGLGGLHVMYGNADNKLDIVPVDFVNNAIIAAAYETVARRERGDTDIRIYTVTRRHDLPFHIGKVHGILQSDDFRKLATPVILWYAYLIITANPVLFFILTWLLHFIPGYLVDGVLQLMGKRKKVIRLFNRAYTHNYIFKYYMFNDWEFGTSNLQDLNQNLSPADRIIYECDPSNVELVRYLRIVTVGVRKYLLKDGLQKTALGRKKHYWLKIANVFYIAGYAYILWKILTLLGYAIFVAIKFILHI